VSFARDHGNLRHRGLGKGVQQLGAVSDDSAELLLRAGQKSGNVFEGDERNVEAIAETHEARALDAGFDVEHAGKIRRLIGDNADRLSIQAGKADHDVLRVVLLNLKEVGVVHDRMNHVLN